MITFIQDILLEFIIWLVKTYVIMTLNQDILLAYMMWYVNTYVVMTFSQDISTRCDLVTASVWLSRVSFVNHNKFVFCIIYHDCNRNMLCWVFLTEYDCSWNYALRCNVSLPSFVKNNFRIRKWKNVILTKLLRYSLFRNK